MAIDKQNLYDYWKSMDNQYAPGQGSGGGILEGPDAPTMQGRINPNTYEGQLWGSAYDLAGTGQGSRAQSAMNFSENYAPETERVNSLSSHLEGVLADDSKYIQRARTKANEASGSRGLLNSSMAAGAAEGAAIDRGLQVAQGDLDADKFNAGEANRVSQLRYDTATGLGAAAQQQGYQLDQGTVDTMYEDFFKDKDQAFKLQEMADSFKYETAKDYQKYVQNFDQAIFDATNERIDTILEKDTLLMSQFLKGWGDIAGSELSGPDAEKRLNQYSTQISDMRTALGAYMPIEVDFTSSGGGSQDVYSIGLAGTGPVDWPSVMGY